VGINWRTCMCLINTFYLLLLLLTSYVIIICLKAALLNGSGDGSYGSRRKSASPIRHTKPLTASQYLLPQKYLAPGTPSMSAATGGSSPTNLEVDQPGSSTTEIPLPSPTHLLPPSPDHSGRMSLVPPGLASATPSPLTAPRRSICRRR